LLGSEGFPRSGGAFVDQPQDIIAQNGFTGIGNPKVVASIAGGGDVRGAGNGDMQILATIGGNLDPGSKGDIEGEFIDALADFFDPVGGDSLPIRGLGFTVFDADPDRTASGIGKAYAVFGQFELSYSYS